MKDNKKEVMEWNDDKKKEREEKRRETWKEEKVLDE